ncbi:type II toxin-antitoxin system VapB family antitoxin [Rhizobium sp. AG855]|uniref:type II toxin-antitoxin system VapB family antitoxin n=1 Tax=Rhizobium sp. AG855 TaxID=2183898 RepID=UPI000E717C9A|nr:type II toxin-antitoxin system VapB family antitoxin [Rhizobium sp. AG855]RKE85628.1 putative transcription factor [Rhizobium sp. AG855]
MAEPQLSVRSARARDLAHRLARRENRSIADIVERALEAYETQRTGREPAADFYRRISAEVRLDLDLDAVIRADREPHEGPEL